VFYHIVVFELDLRLNLICFLNCYNTVIKRRKSYTWYYYYCIKE